MPNIELNKIYCENNLATMARMPDGFIDLTVTSPPYDGLRDYNGYSFDFESMAKELFRVTKQGGVLVWVVGDQVVDGSETGESFRQGLGFMAAGFNLHDTMIYFKAAKYPDSTRYSQCFEFMFILSKGRPAVFNPIKDRKNRWGHSFGITSKRQKNGTLEADKKVFFEDVGIRWNIWKYNVGAGLSAADPIAFQHPAIFPEQLAADHIHSWSNKGYLVYDPFMGSGTTAKMAHLQERNWIGSEISQEYCDIANKRIAPYLQQTKMNLI